MTSDAYEILLIDDDEDEFLNIRDLLNDEDTKLYVITWVPSYEKGLAALRSDKFDACILDYRLGEKTGIDLLKDANKFGVQCPIIFLTGQGDLDLDIQAMQIGAADYLVKDQLTGPLLERSVRYSMKHAFDMAQLRENKAQILQQDRLASLGLLSSSLAHEIGTPMGIIRSRAELIEKKVADLPPVKENIRIIINQIDKVTQLVNSLLHLARSKPSEHASAVSLNQVVQDVLNLLQHEFDRKGIEFKNEILCDCVVKAESGSLGQVLLNLLVNAVHAVDEAKKKGRTDNHAITLGVEEKNQSVIIRIKDTGCGIPEENMEQLFKPFFTTKDVGVGTGLGLATSYNLVRSWGGSISAKNQSGLGAIFEITLLKQL